MRRRFENTARRDTGPERALRSALHRAGYRFRVDRSPVPSVRSRADLLFARERVAIFVDGCFWHGCPEHGTWPKTNADWWRAKLGANQARDARVDADLVAAGWRVVRVWEHESVEESVRRVVAALQIARAEATASDE
ncbi:very short patch repair endonuclease [Sandaracinus amylolyticus]|uniref:very short patch repair endonuclease n=1 Tax=Sandaracinus amylolyticus TaxID=927083 RepID=UPI003AF33AC3